MAVYQESMLGIYKIGMIVVVGVIIFVVVLINSKKGIRYLDEKFDERAEWLVR